MLDVIRSFLLYVEGWAGSLPKNSLDAWKWGGIEFQKSFQRKFNDKSLENINLKSLSQTGNGEVPNRTPADNTTPPSLSH